MTEMLANPEQTALLLIDMHRGHLDPEVATLPVDAVWAAEILANTKTLLQGARAIGMNVIHVNTQYRANKQGMPVDYLLNSNPYARWRSDRGKLNIVQKAARWHNLEGSVQTQFMPEVQPSVGEYTVVKTRYNAFYSTDLDLLLKCLKMNTLVVAGVNTNNCITATTIDGCVRDYAMIVVSDCVASSFGRHLHKVALELIENTFGWVMTSKKILDILECRKGLAELEK